MMKKTVMPKLPIQTETGKVKTETRLSSIDLTHHSCCQKLDTDKFSLYLDSYTRSRKSTPYGGKISVVYRRC